MYDVASTPSGISSSLSFGVGAELPLPTSSPSYRRAAFPTSDSARTEFERTPGFTARPIHSLDAPIVGDDDDVIVVESVGWFGIIPPHETSSTDAGGSFSSPTDGRTRVAVVVAIGDSSPAA